MVDDLKEFYKKNGITTFCDGFSTTVWYYKNVEIAYYMDMDDPEGYIYVANKWAFSKRECREENRIIKPIYKHYGWYVDPDGGWINVPIMNRIRFDYDFNDEKSINHFKEALLKSCRNYDKVEAKLKDKEQMFTKYKNKNLSVNECIQTLNDKDCQKLLESGELVLKNYKKITLDKFEMTRDCYDYDSEFYYLSCERKYYILVRKKELYDRVWNISAGEVISRKLCMKVEKSK